MEVWVSFTILAALMQSLRTAGQKKIAEKIIKENNVKFAGKVVTKLSLLKNYCKAEDYHQNYLDK